MVNQLTKNATLKELEEAGIASYYADHNKRTYRVEVSGVSLVNGNAKLNTSQCASKLVCSLFRSDALRT